MKKPRTPQKKNQTYEVRYSLIEQFCILSAWTGQSIDQIKEWPIPQFFHMWNGYMKERKEEIKVQVKLKGI